MEFEYEEHQARVFTAIAGAFGGAAETARITCRSPLATSSMAMSAPSPSCRGKAQCAALTANTTDCRCTSRLLNRALRSAELCGFCCIIHAPLQRGTPCRTHPSASLVVSPRRAPHHSRFFVRCSQHQPSPTATPTPTQPTTPHPPSPPPCYAALTASHPPNRPPPNTSKAPDRVTVRSPCRPSTPTARTA